MIILNHTLKVLSVFMAGTIIVVNIAFASDMQNDIFSGLIPLPPDAQKVDSPLSAGAGQDAAAYSTAMSQREVIDFYTQELGKKGWGDRQSLLETIGKTGVSMEDIKCAKCGNASQPDINRAMDLMRNMFYFTKPDKTLVLVVAAIPEQNSKVFFSLGYANVPGKALAESENRVLKNQKEQMIKASPLPKSIPLYSSAQLVYSEGKMYIYATAEDAESVVSFYKTTMPGRGWFLKEEEPYQENYIKTPPLKDMLADVPCEGGECPDAEQLPSEILEAWEKGLKHGEGTLDFINNSGERCRISVEETQTPEPSKGLDYSSTEIIIQLF